MADRCLRGEYRNRCKSGVCSVFFHCDLFSGGVGDDGNGGGIDLDIDLDHYLRRVAEDASARPDTL